MIFHNFWEISVKSRSRYYTNLFKSQFGIRNRVLVNGPEFEEEKIGGQEKFFSRLATEWDEYYIHELRYRRPAKKFCVKS